MTNSQDIKTVIQSMLQKLITEYAPRKVVLFGSHAYGAPGPDSDIDLLVVVDDDTPLEAFSAKSLHQARKDYHHAVDILPCRASVLGARAQAKGSFADIVLREGVTVYERR